MKTNFKFNTQLIAFAYVLLVIVFLSSCERHNYKYRISVKGGYFMTDNYKIEDKCIYFKEEIGIGETKFRDVIFCDGFSVVPAE